MDNGKWIISKKGTRGGRREREREREREKGRRGVHVVHVKVVGY